MSLSLTRSINAGFAVALVLLLGVVAVGARTTRQLVETADRVAHSHMVLERLNGLKAALASAEAGRRGLVLTGDRSYAEDLRSAASTARARLDELRLLTADNAAQQRHLDALEARVAQRLDLLGRSVELARTRPAGLADQLALMEQGRAARDDMLRLLGVVQGLEQVLLLERDAAAKASARRSTLVALLGSVAATVVAALSLLTIHRQIRERRRAEETVRRSEAVYRTLLSHFPNGAVFLFDRDLRYRLVEGEGLADAGLSKAELEGKTIWEALPPATCEAIEPAYRAALAGNPSCSDVPFAGRTYEVHFSPIRDGAGEVQAGMVVTQDVTERRQAEDEVRRLNRELGRHIAELREVNRELEAFSYSVSHDLRAPLRHIHGFVDLLTRRGRDALDETGRRYLETIAQAAQRMGELIDDLLAFSRVGRVELARRPVDLAVLVEEVIRQLGEENPGRQVAWARNGLPEVVADPSLLRVVLTNLLGNALKYTQGRAPAEVAVGWRREGDELVVFVRDNGVGFDMRYVDKLFGVFQRLHRPDEFEGTGIGLATVRRIIHRHGGRTWAEGTVGGGAVFYFSLPSVEEAPS